MSKRHRRKLPFGADNLMSVFEGIEGGFAIFTGIVVGLSFQDISRDLLIFTALIGIIVNAFNSSSVRYTSEHYIDELDGRETSKRFSRYFVPSLIEFFVYTIVSGVVILPLLFIGDLQLALSLCVALTLTILFAAGAYRGQLLRARPLRDGFEMALLGALIVFVGGMSGYLLSR